MKNFDNGDSNKKILILTRDFGLVWAKVQSARSMKSRLRYSVQNYSYGKFSLIKGRIEWKLASAISNSNIYEDFKNNFEKLKILTNVFNLVTKLSGEDETNEKLFIIISNFIKYIKDAKNDKLHFLECLILLKILNVFGYMRNDPDFVIPINSLEISEEDVLSMAPKREVVIRLINESLKVSNLI